MLCIQCEQTNREDNKLPGCMNAKGACGKDSNTSDLQDILIHQVLGLAELEQLARKAKINIQEVDKFIKYAVFTTLTNVNFSLTRFQEIIIEADKIKLNLVKELKNALDSAFKLPAGPAQFIPESDLPKLLSQASSIGMRSHENKIGQDANGLWLLILYGLKGACAYAHHAQVLGYREDSIDNDLCSYLSKLSNPTSNLNDLFQDAMNLGTLNIKIMELLDKANTECFGIPNITQARITPVKGKAILVSGHDLKDLSLLLEQTKDTGINVYTHGEMLPANSYPKLKEYKHLIGNYGGAWQDQQKEFAEFLAQY